MKMGFAPTFQKCLQSTPESEKINGETLDIQTLNSDNKLKPQNLKVEPRCSAKF